MPDGSRKAQASRLFRYSCLSDNCQPELTPHWVPSSLEPAKGSAWAIGCVRVARGRGPHGEGVTHVLPSISPSDRVGRSRPWLFRVATGDDVRRDGLAQRRERLLRERRMLERSLPRRDLPEWAAGWVKLHGPRRLVRERCLPWRRLRGQRPKGACRRRMHGERSVRERHVRKRCLRRRYRLA